MEVWDVSLGTFWYHFGDPGVPRDTQVGTWEGRSAFFMILGGFWDLPGSQVGSLSTPFFIKMGIGNRDDFLTRFLLISGVVWRGLDPENPSKLMEGCSKTRDGASLEKVTLGSDFLQF